MRRRLSSISRRDFLNGAAITVAAGMAPNRLLGQPAHASAAPPSLTGLRGAHTGSFEVAHSVAWQGRQWKRPEKLADEPYDLVVVGAGLSGLAAAFVFRQRTGPDARILILDNHDDFGGHAKRNEFMVDGQRLIGYGGSQSIDTPSSYSPAAAKLLKDLGVEVSRFYDYYDQSFYQRLNMGQGIYFDAAHYGVNRLTGMPFGPWGGMLNKAAAGRAIDEFPFTEEERKAFRELVFDERDYLDAAPRDERMTLLRRTSYENFLRDYAKAPDAVIVLLRRSLAGLWGVGWDALSALEAARWGMPGVAGLKLDALSGGASAHDEPYIFHFPDGNASLARLLVRALVPASAPGETMEDIVLAGIDYAQLDVEGSPVRVRLLSTAVDLRNTADGKAVDVTYVRDGEAFRVRSRHAVMAGYNAMAPYICPEMPAAQKKAIRVAEKIPLVYANVALRNWRAFAEAGYHRLYAPQAFYESMMLDFPVSMGGYEFAKSPDEPIILHMTHVPTEPGLTEREQHRAGRQKLYVTPFEAFENAIIEELEGAFGAHGFDAAREIAGITVNRWPHGYAYEYNELYDPADWSPENGPHIEARAPIGRISIANSDASAYAYVNGAFDAAVRAIAEQLAL